MSGKLRHKMTVYLETSADGDDQVAWTVWRSDVPCDIVPVGGSETYRGKQLEATTSHVIETRFFPGFLQTMKLIDGRNRTYEISRIFERDGRRNYIDIHATEVVV